MQRFITRVSASVLALALGCSAVAAETAPAIAAPADNVAEAIDRLGYDSPSNTQSVQQLLEYLDSEDAQHRWRAARALGVMEYEPATGRLVELLEDSDPVVQIHAIIALGRIGDKSPETIDAIIDQVDSSDPRVVRTALLALSELKPGPEKAAEAIEAAVVSEDSAVMTHVVEALVEAGPRANPLLIKALAKEKTAYWAAMAIAEIGPGSAPRFPPLSSCSIIATTPAHSSRRYWR